MRGFADEHSQTGSVQPQSRHLVRAQEGEFYSDLRIEKLFVEEDTFGVDLSILMV